MGHFATLRVDGAIAQIIASRPALTRETPTDTLAEVNSVILSLRAHTRALTHTLLDTRCRALGRWKAACAGASALACASLLEDAPNDTAHHNAFVSFMRDGACWLGVSPLLFN